MKEIEKIFKDIKPLSNIEKRMVSVKGFFSVYYEIRCGFRTSKEAYNYLEEIYQRMTGKRKYVDYDSFRRVRDRFKRIKKG